MLIATILLVIVTALLVIITAIYAKQTWRMAEEMRKQTEAIMGFYIEESKGGLNVYTENTGLGCARNIEIKYNFSPALFPKSHKELGEALEDYFGYFLSLYPKEKSEASALFRGGEALKKDHLVINKKALKPRRRVKPDNKNTNFKAIVSWYDSSGKHKGEFPFDIYKYLCKVEEN